MVLRIPKISLRQQNKAIPPLQPAARAGMSFAVAGLLVLVTAVLAMSALSHARGILRWQDENGIWHFTDSPTQPSEIPDSQNETPASGTIADDGRFVVHDTPEDNIDNSITGGMLWQIERRGLKSSYLLGTIHSSDRRITRLTPVVAGALDSSAQFVMEMEFDATVLMQFGTAMVLDEGRDLESLLGTRLFRKTVAAMEARGMPEMVVRQLKPWVAMAMLSMPRSDGGTILDMVLRQRAADRGIPTAGLETAAEQLAVFDSLAVKDQIALLTMTIDQLPHLPAFFEQLIQAYAADDLDRIVRLSRRAMSHASGDTARRFMQKLNVDRNRRMADRIVPYIEQGNSFIAVGSLHLAGPDGLLTLLAQRGYATRAVPQ
jgi:uncharacterized protein YbaP (TraB family)